MSYLSSAVLSGCLVRRVQAEAHDCHGRLPTMPVAGRWIPEQSGVRTVRPCRLLDGNTRFDISAWNGFNRELMQDYDFILYDTRKGPINTYSLSTHSKV